MATQPDFPTDGPHPPARPSRLTDFYSEYSAIQGPFGWLDDHLYYVWLYGAFWGDKEREFTDAGDPDEAPQTADVPLAELDLAVGANIAYVFGFGDEWRVRLTLREQTRADAGAYPRVLKRNGTAPLQYATQRGVSRPLAVVATEWRLRVAGVQAPVGALVDATRGTMCRVALAEGDQAPRQRAIRVHGELEDEPVRRF